MTPLSKALVLTLALSARGVAAQQITLVSPHSGTVTVGANLTNRQVTFTVSSQSNQSSSRTITILQCSGQVTSCSAPGSVTFIQSTNVTVTFTSLGGGTGTIVLYAQGSTSSDQGTITVTVTPPYGVTVTPDGGTEPTRTANTGGYSAAFTVKNTGSNANTYSFSCTGATGVTCGTVPGSLPLSAGAQQVVNMPYSVGGPGTGTLTFTATGTSTSDPGSVSVPIVSYGVSVTPDAQIAATRFTGSATYSETFTVQNTGSGSNTYTFACTGAGGISCVGAPSNLTLSAGTLTTVTQSYTVGTTAGTGTLTLTASGTNASDPGSFSIPIALTVSTVSGGVLTLDINYLLQQTASSYDSSGRITRLLDARNVSDSFTYGGNVTNAFLTKITRLHDGTGTIDLATENTYDNNGFVSSIKDPGGSLKNFTYDAYGRLRQIKNNGGIAVRAYGYTYSRTTPNWTFDPANPNAVVDSTFMQQTPVQQVAVSTGYFDGLGRPIQNVAQDGTNYHVHATEYDLMGRTWHVWKPYTRSTGGFDPNATSPSAGATAWYNSYHTPSTTVPYVETAYTADPLNRVRQVTPEHLVGAPSAVVVHGYGIDVTNRLQQTLITDEAGKSARSGSDLFGNVVRSVLGATAPESTVTQFAYDVVGQRVQATDPRGLITTFVRNTRGLQTSKTSPDAGTVNGAYDKAGNLRFTQDVNQTAAGQVYFTNYDFATRPLRSGLATATFFALNPDITETIENDANCPTNCLVVRQYDAKPSTSVFPWSRFTAQITPSLVMNNVAGRLAAVASKSNGAWQATLFSYDADGQVVRRYIFTEANGGASVLTAINTTVTDSLDLRGSILRRADTIGTYYFYQWYDYNGRGLLAKLYASTTSPNTKPTTPDDTDSYRPSGLPSGYQFQGSLFEPIRYTIREQTQQIGDPTGTTYRFSARYAYQLNGVVDTAEFYSGGSPVAPHYRWTFGAAAYDALNRLKRADYSFWNVSTGTWNASPNYTLAAITYDGSGNLQTLQRNNEAGTLIDNLVYNYVAGTNRLGSLTENAGATTTIPWDAEGGSFGYDANGNVTSAPDPYSIAANGVIYDAANLPLSITAASVTTTFRYDYAGERITKQKTGQDTQVYLRDGATVLGVFNVNGSGTATAAYFNLTWDGRVIGRQTVLPLPTARTYDHFDALGSIRAVVSTTGAVQESYDYEPWGLLMAGRTLTTATPTKDGFTGKEQDAETGLDYFGARYYMPALGRWSTPDPLAARYAAWSSYNYVTDNPVALVDLHGDSVYAEHAHRGFLGIFGKKVTERAVYRGGSWYTPGTNDAFSSKNRTMRRLMSQTAGSLSAMQSAGGDAATAANFLIGDAASTVNVRSHGIKSGVTWEGPASNKTVEVNLTGETTPLNLLAAGTGKMASSGVTSGAHELGHAYDFFNNVSQNYTPNPLYTFSNGKPAEVSEIYAMHIENLVRKSQGLALRAFYGTDNGTPVGEALTPGTTCAAHVPGNPCY